MTATISKTYEVEASPFKALKQFVETLRNWWKPILNYFVGRFNNAFAEGVNLKIKMLNRRGFGYQNFKSFRLYVLVALIPFSAKTGEPKLFIRS